ncbi:MAG: hypothetical protein K6D03_05675 [Solobacterium sp.]|nr:hypothetical protein [Solobacterium sp.]
MQKKVKVLKKTDFAAAFEKKKIELLLKKAAVIEKADHADDLFTGGQIRISVPYGVLMVLKSKKELEKNSDAYDISDEQSLKLSAEKLTAVCCREVLAFEDVKKIYRIALEKAVKSEEAYSQSSKELHRLLTSSKNIKLQNDWLKRENNERDRRSGGLQRMIKDYQKALDENREEYRKQYEKYEISMQALKSQEDTVQRLEEQLKTLTARSAADTLTLTLSDKIFHPGRSRNISKIREEIAGSIAETQEDLERTRKILDAGRIEKEKMDAEIERIEERRKKLDDTIAGFNESYEKAHKDFESGKVMLDKGLRQARELDERIRKLRVFCISAEEERKRSLRDLTGCARMMMRAWVRDSELAREALGSDDVMKVLSVMYLVSDALYASGTTSCGYLADSDAGWNSVFLDEMSDWHMRTRFTHIYTN